MEIQILNDTNVIGDFREFSERIDSLAKYEISELLNICNEICSLLLQIDDHGLEKFIKYWIKNFERCDQIVNILTYIVVLSTGDKDNYCTKFIEKLSSMSTNLTYRKLIIQLVPCFLWTYITRCFCPIESIPQYHFFPIRDPVDILKKNYTQENDNIRPEFKFIEYILLNLCQFSIDCSEKYSLGIQNYDTSINIIQNYPSKMKLQKVETGVRNTFRFQDYILKHPDKFPEIPKDQVELIHLTISNLLIPNLANYCTVSIWITILLCESLSDRGIIPLYIETLNLYPKFNMKSSEVFSNIRIPLSEEILINISKTLCKCLYVAIQRKIKDKDIKIKLCCKVKETIETIVRRSICEMMPQCAAFASNCSTLIRPILDDISKI
ncbi:hypothetical protein cand_030970 [Cryptosporidium andersoni]|uniref:Uncharacterized protein n=1 Tax=Cryptosporidium andersoni TaxID=117008 RepID=A0A1J4MQF2_9CRYT|nr:hypothetical protein cand_030970 [Cryptosporidium andersoni]